MVLTNVEGTATALGVDVYAVLVSLTGRRLTMQEVYEAVGLSSPQYYETLKQGKLIRGDRLIKAATHLGINPVALMVECGVLSLTDVASYAEQRRRAAREALEACGGEERSA